MENISENFLYELFAISLKNKSTFEVINSSLKSHYFPSEEWRELWSEIEQYHESNNRMPTIGALNLSFRQDRDVRKIISNIKKQVSVDSKSVLITFEDFIRQSFFIDTFTQLEKTYNRGQKEKAFDLFVKKAEEFANFSLSSENFERIFKDFNKRMIDRKLDGDTIDEVIPTGLPIDDLMDGGMRKGESTLILGPSGSTKSLFLIHCGIHAARKGFNVVHFQLEGTKKQIRDRYDAAWTGTLYRDLRKGVIDKNKNKAFQKIVERIRGEVFLEAHEQFEEITFYELRSRVLELMKKINIDLVIVDYFELATPGDHKYRPSEERERQDKLAKQFKALAVETNTAVLTVTQASNIPKEYLNDPDFVLTRNNLSEHKTKIKPFDNFFTLNQTDDEHMFKIMRMYADKLRDHDARKIIHIIQNPARSRFFDKAKTMEKMAEFLSILEDKKNVFDE